MATTSCGWQCSPTTVVMPSVRCGSWYRIHRLPQHQLCHRLLSYPHHLPSLSQRYRLPRRRLCRSTRCLSRHKIQQLLCSLKVPSVKAAKSRFHLFLTHFLRHRTIVPVAKCAILPLCFATLYRGGVLDIVAKSDYNVTIMLYPHSGHSLISKNMRTDG